MNTENRVNILENEFEKIKEPMYEIIRALGEFKITYCPSCKHATMMKQYIFPELAFVCLTCGTILKEGMVKVEYKQVDKS